MQTAAQRIRSAADKLDNAYDCYARDNGDGFSDHDYRGAYAYREEGYRLAEAAADMCEEDRQDWIDTEAYAFPTNAQYLVACAAEYRLIELEEREARTPSFLPVAAEIVGVAA